MTQNTMKVVYHAELSDAHPGETYWLHARGKRHNLKAHTADTLGALRAAAPHLSDVKDEHLTHYTEEAVELPTNSVVRVHLKHSMRTFGKPEHDTGVSHVDIHSPGCLTGLQGESASGYNAAINYVTTAKSLAFHHPDLINADKDTTRRIKSYMNDNDEISDEFDNLGAAFRRKGPAKEKQANPKDDGWAVLEPMTPDNGDEHHGDKTYYFHQPTEDSMTLAGPALTMMMVATKNDQKLEVQLNPATQEWQGKWTQQAGQSVVSQPVQEHLEMLAQVDAVEALEANDWTAKLSNYNITHGLQASLQVVDADKKELKVTFKNTFIRYLGAYVRFIDADGNPLKTPDWKADNTTANIINDIMDVQYPDLRFVGLVGPVNNVIAIPIVSDPGELEITFTMPKGAVSVVLYGSGLGTGSNEKPKTPIVGGVLTGLVNLGIPAFMLGFGVAAQSYSGLYKIMEELSSNKKFIAAVITVGIAYFGANFGSSAANGKMDWKSFSTLAKLLFDKAALKALLWVEAETAGQAAAEEIPFAGWILLTLNIATGVAQMAETIVEVATSPWNIENAIATSITSKVTLHPDPQIKTWPQAPAGVKPSYTAKLMYRSDARPSVVRTVNLPADLTDKILVNEFKGNTLGGHIKIEINYYFDNWTAGKATTGWMENTQENAADIEMWLVQRPIPLSDESIYQHTSILGYPNQDYGWTRTTQAPSATITSRDTSKTGNAISEWYGLSLSQKNAQIGWAWRAAGMGIKSASGGNDGQLGAMINASIPGKEMSDVTFPIAGFVGATQLIYDPYPPKFEMKNGEWVIDPKTDKPIPDPTAKQLGDYFIDPRKADADPQKDGGFHLRKVDLASDAPFDLSGESLSYGRFPFFPASFVLHPAGYAIAVTNVNQSNKLQIVKLVLDGAIDDLTPMARTYAGQAMDDKRHGLLFHPVAVTCSYDGTVIVLEDSKSSDGERKTVVSRLQAFDLYGNPVNRFRDVSGQPSPFLPLSDADNLTYLDVCAVGNEKMTYMYVLYYVGAGENVSDYYMAIYQYGENSPATNPLVVTNGVPAAKLAVDMWHSVYTLNYAMTEDDKGSKAGPLSSTTGPNGRTVPSISLWMPPLPSVNR